jgi:hypothetical protein
MQKLRVIAAPGHLVSDDVAYQGGARFRFLGRSPVAAKTDAPENLELRFPPREREYEDSHPNRYIRRALQKGSVLPCDEHTARVAGVRFDPRLVEKIKKDSGDLPETEKKTAPKTQIKGAQKDGDS